MKTYNLEEIKELAKNSASLLAGDEMDEISYSPEEFDKAKTRMLKFIFYKKRTVREVIKKFANEYSEEIMDDVISYLKDNGYLDDSNYVQRAVNDFMVLKHLSIKEIKYKLLSKGVNLVDIENYINLNYDQLLDYEIKSAQYWAQKKKSQMECFEIKRYLIKKGYKEESIKEAL